MEIIVFEVSSGRWAYQVGGVYQENNPLLDGFVAMTESEATSFAQETKTRLEQCNF
jgi:hypothetical protein